MRAQTQPGQVPEFFVTGLGHIELMGSNARHVLVSEHMIGGKVIYVPQVHIIMPNSAVPEGIRKAMLIPELGGTVRLLMPQYKH